jgi:hypothetical protein
MTKHAWLGLIVVSGVMAGIGGCADKNVGGYVAGDFEGGPLEEEPRPVIADAAAAADGGGDAGASDHHADANVDSDLDANIDNDLDANVDSDANIDLDANVDSDANIDLDANVDSDAGEPAVDAGPVRCWDGGRRHGHCR